MAIAPRDLGQTLDEMEPVTAAQSGTPSGVSRLEDVVEGSLAGLARRLVETEGVNPTLEDVLSQAVVAVPCTWAAAAVMEAVPDRPARLSASTDDGVAALTAQIAAASGSSPGIEAFQTGEVVHAPDLSSEDRFGSYPAEIVRSTPIRSVLSVPLRLHERTLGVLTLYADRPAAFDTGAIERARELADLAAVAIDASVTHERADGLSHALDNSRSIGMAIGVLVERYKLTPEQAFEQLSRASQHANRKLVDLAIDITETGEFNPPPNR